MRWGEEIKMLHLRIGGDWEPQDFIELLHSVESMYYKLTVSDYGRVSRLSRYRRDFSNYERDWGVRFTYFVDGINQDILDRARYEAKDHERFFVRRISYASPGSVDLLGIGKVCEVIANSIQSMVSYFDEKGIRRERDEQATLETERKRIEIEQAKENLRSLKIKNAKDTLDLLERFPDDRDVLVPLLVRDQDALSALIAGGKLIGASLSSERGATRD